MRLPAYIRGGAARGRSYHAAMLRSHTGAPQGWWSSVRGRIQETAFNALYGPGARIYDRFTRWLFLGEWEAWQQAALVEVPTSGVVIELGSGTGALASVGASRERRWLGCEISPAMLRVAQARTATTGAWFVRASAEALPVADAAADAVVATFPSRFILDPQTAAEAARVLRPGGLLVVALTGSLTPDGFARRARRLALNLFYGDPHGAAPTFEVPQFAGTTRPQATPHGVVQIYVGTVVQRS